MSQFIFRMFILSVFLLTGVRAGFAQEGNAVAEVPAGEAPVAMEAIVPAAEAPVAMEAVAPAAEMTEEQKAMQARMQEFTTVNANHEALKALEGKWTTHAKFWMDPKGPAEESDGTSEAKMIMNGRFLEQNFTGTIMGQPYEGRGTMGYDNMKKEYVTTWLDNMGTGIMTSAGQFDADKKVLTTEGSMSCPVVGDGHRWYKEILTIVDADHYTYESYMKDKDGNEYKGMEIVYTRAQ